MGSQQCSSCDQHIPYSSAYGNFQLLVENNHQYAVISKSIHKQTMDPYELDRQLKKRSALQSSYVSTHPVIIVKLYSYCIAMDSYFIKIELKYEYIPLTLRQKYAQWRSADRILSQSEIGNLLSGVESALMDLIRVGTTHRFVNLDTILCVKSMYKLVDTSMLTFLTGLDLARGGDQQQFLSEKNLNVLNLKGTKPDYDIQDDLFSLGMIVIVIVLKCHPKDLYQENMFGERRHHVEKIEEGLRLIDRLYDGWIGKKMRELLWGCFKSSNATCNLETTTKRHKYE